MKSEMNIQALDGLIKNVQEKLTELYKQRHELHTKIIMSILKEIYHKYQFVKKDNSTLKTNPYFLYTTNISDEDIDRFIKELNLQPQYPREISFETFDTDSNIGIRLRNSFLVIYDYILEKSPFNWNVIKEK